MGNSRKARREARKEKIRRAYEIAPEDFIVIPADPALSPAKDMNEQELRVAPYCRVSTKEEAQAESIEMQKQYYTKLIENHPNWHLVKVYYDDGRSGTSIRRRDDFQELIEACKAGKVDMIITKAVSRFARNVVDCVSHVRMLRDLDPPVGVYFEELGMNTLGQTGDMLVAIMGAIAQAESESKSISVSWGFRNRFSRGLPKWSNSYGYQKTETGDIEIIPQEAVVIRQIYESFLAGASISQIARILDAADVATYYEKGGWSYSTVRYILSNERYCGDAGMQKTIRIDIFTHKTIQNKGQLPRYLKKNVYPPIVDRVLWESVQERLKTNAGHMPNYRLDHVFVGVDSKLCGFDQIILKERIQKDEPA